MPLAQRVTPTAGKPDKSGSATAHEPDLTQELTEHSREQDLHVLFLVLNGSLVDDLDGHEPVLVHLARRQLDVGVLPFGQSNGRISTGA